jgi:hypothetical protein
MFMAATQSPQTQYNIIQMMAFISAETQILLQAEASQIMAEMALSFLHHLTAILQA